MFRSCRFSALPWLLFSSICLTAGAAQDMNVLEAFAQDPAMSDAQVSPDGRHLATLQRFEKDGQQFLLIYDVANLAKDPVRLGASKTSISGFSWVNNDRLVVIFRQDVDTLQRLGANTRLVTKLAVTDREGRDGFLEIPKRRADRRSSAQRRAEEFRGARIFSMLPRDDNHILIEYDDDQNGVPDIYKVHVKKGTAKRVARNRAPILITGLDEDMEPRLASRYDVGNASFIQYARLKGKKQWLEIGRLEPRVGTVSQSLQPFFVHGGPESNEFLVASNHESDTAGIYLYDLESRSFGEVQFRHNSYDVTDIRSVTDWSTGHGRRILGFGYSGRSRDSVHLIDPKEQAIYEGLEGYFGAGELNLRIVSRSRNEKVLVVRVEGPRQPSAWYLLNDGRISLLGNSLPGIRPEMLSEVEWTGYAARDGTWIPALVTVPDGEGPFPLVVHPHGGPVARDYWGFDLWAQVLAHHGYLVIQPQFRISEGFGRKHLQAGFGRWGKEMQDDLDDAIGYLARRGLADPKRVAIFGWSYGGYAAFVGSFRDPNPYSCAVAGAGVADLPYFRAWLGDGGDFTDATYRRTVDGINPLDHVASVDVPVLVIHGDKDERVPVAESRKFVRELKKHNKQHRYIEMEGANHFFGTIYYRHWMEMFPAMLDWLDHSCDLKSS